MVSSSTLLIILGAFTVVLRVVRFDRGIEIIAYPKTKDFPLDVLQ